MSPVSDDVSPAGPEFPRVAPSTATPGFGGVDRLGQSALPRGDHVPPEHARTIRAIFAEVAGGYSAIGRLRATGFLIDRGGSLDGDLIVCIPAVRTRIDELDGLVAAHGVRIDKPQGTSGP
jgi:hypothetical protein